MYQLLKAFIQTKYLMNFRTREHLENWQNRQVVHHLKKIIPLSPFYASCFQNMDIDQWRQLLPIDKKIMMEHFDQLNTRSISAKEAFEIAYAAEKSRSFTPTIKDITVGLSSGTSGNRGIFLVSPQERQRWAGTILAKTLPETLFKPQKIALFLRANSNLYQTVKNPHLDFQFYDLLDPFDDHLTRLKLNPPTILVAPPSVLRMIANAKMHLPLKKVISIAEVLDPIDEVYLTNAFNQHIHQIYQCTEGFLAVSCPHGILHLNEDVAVIEREYVAPNKFIPIITDFRRTTQPIIRYRLNDLLTLRSTPCACGSIFTALEKIEGRCDDIFYLPHLDDPKKSISLFPDYIRGAIVDASSEIQEFIAVQKSTELIEISLKHASQSNSLIEEKVRNSLDALCEKTKCRLPPIKFTPYMTTYSDKKMRRIRSEYDPN